MKCPDLREFLQHGTGRQSFLFLLRANDPKERHLKTERQEADGYMSLYPILTRQVHRQDHEELPLAILETMAARLPVASTRVGGASVR